MLNRTKNKTFYSQKIKPMLCLAALLSVSTSTLSYERWFEVEVILFSQLGDKNEIKEEFPKDTPSITRKRFYDIITPNLRPEIATLKQTLNRCDGQSAFFDFSHPRPLIESIEPQVVDTDIVNQALPENDIANSDLNDEANELSNNDLINQELIKELQQEQPTFSNEQQQQDPFQSDFTDEFTDLSSPEEIPIKLLPLEEALEEIKWQLKAETEIQAFENEIDIMIGQEEVYGQVIPHISFSQNSGSLFCVTQEEVLSQQHPVYGFDVNEIPKDKIPTSLSGLENIDSKTPYLISADSLQLNYIVKQLKRSKEFRPLLHLGWRQATLSKKRAIPIKIFAGDNLQHNYEDQLKAIQLQQKVGNEFAEENSEDSTPFESQLNQIIQHAIQKNYNQGTVISQAKASGKTELQKPIESPLGVDTNVPQELIAPNQEYWLDGFLTIHLNHYLYISAEFNLQNQLNVSFDKDSSSQIIKFHQSDRRVISGQIHYFDHPYIGMVIQIRKYKKPEPKVDDESANS